MPDIPPLAALCEALDDLIREGRVKGYDPDDGPSQEYWGDQSLGTAEVAA